MPLLKECKRCGELIHNPPFKHQKICDKCCNTEQRKQRMTKLGLSKKKEIPITRAELTLQRIRRARYVKAINQLQDKKECKRMSNSQRMELYSYYKMKLNAFDKSTINGKKEP